MKQKYLILCLILFVLSSIYCGSPENANSQENYTIDLRNGIQYVHNLGPKWNTGEKFQLEFVKKIGGLEETDENLLFFKPVDIAIDSDENIYVLDSGNFRIQKFDKNGIFILTFGKKGEGPGELKYPSGIQIDAERNIHVTDSELNRIQIFNSEGDPIRTYTTKMFTFDFILTNDGSVLVDGLAFGDDLSVIHLFDQNGSLVTSMGKRKEYLDSQMNVNGNRVKAAVDDNNNIYLAYRARNLIEKYTQEGNMLLSISRELDYSESEKRENVEVKIMDMVLPMRKNNEFAHDVQVDSKNRIWVVANSRQLTNEEYKTTGVVSDSPDLVHLEVYDESGILLSNIPLEFGSSRRMVALKNNRIFFVDTELDMAVFVYEIVEK